MSRVFVINEPRPCKYTGKEHLYDVTPAEVYGDIEFLFFNDEGSASDDPDYFKALAERRLTNFGADDFLVWAGGDPFAMVVAVSVLAKMNMSAINYLKWDRVTAHEDQPVGRYLPVQLNLGE